MPVSWTQVNSSNINRCGYDSDAKALYIEFKNSSVYRYADVPQDEFDALVSASSVGQAFASDIKDVYPYTKV